MERSDPVVTVLVTHHLNKNDEYLYWCLKSITASKGVELEVICLSDADKTPAEVIPSGVKLIWDPAMGNTTAKWIKGKEASHKASKYIMCISDDVMISNGTIAELVTTIGDQLVIMNPASNCDSTTRFYANFALGNKERFCPVPVKCVLDQIKGFEQDVIGRPIGDRIAIDPGWVSFYCTIFPKKVFEIVGDLDDRMDCRHNDVDFCQRARAKGIPSLIHLGGFALHFGDKTLPYCTTEEEYARADEAYRQKYRL